MLLASLLKKWMNNKFKDLFLGSILYLFSLCLFIRRVLYPFDYYNFIVSLENRQYNISRFLEAIQSLLWYRLNVRIFFSNSVKNDYIDYVDHLGSYEKFLTVLALPTWSRHLLKSSGQLCPTCECLGSISPLTLDSSFPSTRALWGNNDSWSNRILVTHAESWLLTGPEQARVIEDT